MAAALAGSAAVAQRGPADDTPIDLVRPGMVDLTNAYSARHLLDLDVRGAVGEPLGEIHNLVVGTDGRIDSVIIESQGFLDVGDTHFAVPWRRLDVASNGAYAKVPVREASLPNFSFFDGDESRPSGTGTLLAADLIGEIVEIRKAMTYRTVDDLVIDRSGQVRAVVVVPARPIGPLGASADRYGEAYDPAQPYYRAAARSSTIAELGPFATDKLGLGTGVER